ncbi:hypothetical protein ABMA27_008821 [Loxostege sticticalis]|uniref:THAP-type domain-containing protein n=1 Tax=Loxostege sticticalis TaxID=481309 RepID=A0ABR3H8Z4_LOXSC
MTICIIKSCRNQTTKRKEKTNITFHKVPADPVAAQKWIEQIRLSRNDPTWTPSEYTRICSAHFLESDLYNTNGGYVRLHKHAYPVKTTHYCQPLFKCPDPSNIINANP